MSRGRSWGYTNLETDCTSQDIRKTPQKSWKFHAMGTTWHSSTAKNIKGRAWIYTQSRWSPRRCHDLEPQPWISSPIILTLSFLPSVFQTFQPSLAVPDFKSPWFLLLLHQPSASLLPSIFFRLPAPQSFPCRLPLNTKSFLK